MCKLLQSFPEADREELLKRKGTTHLSELVHDLEHERRAPGRRIMDNISIPDCDLSKLTFFWLVSFSHSPSIYVVKIQFQKSYKKMIWHCSHNTAKPLEQTDASPEPFLKHCRRKSELMNLNITC